jgi:site-specific recombinase XerD
LKIPEILTPEEQVLLLKQPNPRYYTGERNKALLRLMLDTGLRVAEATALKWNDLDLQTGKLHVKQGKGKKDRLLWIGESTLEQLQKLRERQAKDAPTAQGKAPEYVFSTRDGDQISPRFVQQMVKRYRERCGFNKQVTPHTLRHTFATDLLRETKNIRLVQKALGHASLSTTQIYTHIVDEELEDALKNFRKSA